MGARRYRALIRGLGPNTAFHRSLDPDGWAWSSAEELMALQAELLDAIARMTFLANAKPGTTPPKPLEVQRPNRPTTQKTTKGSTLSELFATR